MQTEKSRYYTMREMAALMGLPSSTLRFWESEFEQLRPKRTQSGQRRYSLEDVAMARRIKELLYVRGLHIEAARAVLDEEQRKAPRGGLACDCGERACELLREALELTGEGVRERIEAVLGWLESDGELGGVADPV